jgi:hypothetical protein
VRYVTTVLIAAAATALYCAPATAGPISITKQSDLSFGKVVLVGTSGTIILPPSGFATYSGVVSSGGLAPTPARFIIKGDPNTSIQVRLTYPISGTYGAGGVSQLDALKVQADYTLGFSQIGTYVKLRLDSGGTNALTVGGTMKLNTPTPGLTDILFPIELSLAL